MVDVRNIPLDVIEEVKKRLKDGEKESNVRRFFREKMGLKKSRGNVIYNQLNLNQEPATAQAAQPLSEKDKIKNLEFEKGYIFNKEDKVYIAFLKSAGRAIVVDEHLHNAMLRAYTSSENTSVSDICSSFNFPEVLFRAYAKLFNWTRSSSHLSDEVVENHTVEELVESTIQEKKWQALQESKKRIWAKTESDSRKWQEFEENVLFPFKRVVENWQPSNRETVPLKTKPKDGLKFICSLADNHLGELFEKNKAYHGREFNSEIACEIIDNYFLKIKETVSSRKEHFSSGLIILTGDYLHSFVDGMTRKGTLLHSDKTNEDMFRIGLDTLARFIENFSALFPLVKIFSTVGNHESCLLTYLAIALEKHFGNNPNISFSISDSWASLHRIGNIAMLITHGANDKIKKDLPPIGLRLKNFVQELLLIKSDELVGCKSRVILSGHRHSFGQFDFGSFEFYCLGAPILGDSYADALGLYSSPRQNCLIADNDRIIETLHYYF